ncbi:MAG: glycosyltransferase [Holdemanella sp.]|nr:glycosyltransferase [Holdemanella sp.]
MKVLQINSFFTVGGPPRIVNGIYDTLKENGHDCKIAAAREELYVPEDSIRIGSKKDAYINALKARVFDNEGFNAKSATLKLIKDIEAYNPDIIHLHNLHGYFINVEILFDYLKKTNKPIVWTLHDCWTMTGHCAHFDFIGCDKWKTQCFDCPQLKEYPSSFGLDHSKNNYISKKESFTGVPNMTIVTVSEWLKSVVKDSYLKEYDVKVIPNGLDLTKFKPVDCSNLKEKYGLQNKKVVLGVAQNWGLKKGLYDFFELSKILPENYQLVMIGLTKNQLKELPKNILGFERTNSIEELSEWYSVSDVFVNLSYEETMGLVTVEAMACGTPAIVYDRTAVPEVIDSHCGWIVKAGNVQEIKRRIETLDTKQNYVDACLNRAKAFEKNKQYNKYIKLYESLIERN